MASLKKTPMTGDTPATPTTLDPYSGDSGLGPISTEPSNQQPDAGAQSTGGFNPTGAPGKNKRYESAIGVEGRKVTPVDSNGMPTGESTYEGYKARGTRTFETMGKYLGTPFIPSMPDIQPRYFISDLDNLGSKTRGFIASWQSRLTSAGLLGNKFALGVVDNQTRSAYGEVLAIANREGITDEEALALVTQRKTSLGGSVQRYRLSNPTDIKVVIRAVAQDALGKSLDDNDVNKLVKLFQQEELSARKEYQAGGVVTDMPSAQNFVESKIQKDFGEEASTRKLDQLFSGIDQALSGSK